MKDSAAANQSKQENVRSAREKLKKIIDDGSFTEIDQNLASVNVLKFPGYDEKLKKAETVSSENEAVISGYATINKKPCVIVIFEPLFMMGSMGSVAGEKITRAFELATKRKLPIITITASGGARMQEGVYSLMQMSKTASAVYKHSRQAPLIHFRHVQPYAGRRDGQLCVPGRTSSSLRKTLRSALRENASSRRRFAQSFPTISRQHSTSRSTVSRISSRARTSCAPYWPEY